MTAPTAIVLLGAAAFIAIAAASVATLRARAARAALRVGDQKQGESVELARKMEAASRRAGDVAHELNDLLTAITRHAELLIASLDPSSASLQDACEIRRAALSASRLTEPLRTLSGGHRAPTDVIVDAILRQAGGRIQVDSAAGVGTTFTIDLPATSEPAAVPDRALAQTRPTAPVLVVDDEPGMREFIRLVLVRAGHAAVTVAGPHAALAALHRQPAIPLMLVDVVMPEMDGYDLVAEARKISPGIRVVFVSAFAPDPARHPSGDGFLAKPFTMESLTAIVEEALSR